MQLDFVHTLLLFLMAGGLISKMAFHWYLDHKHNRIDGTQSTLSYPLQLLLPYTEVVKYQYRNMRQLVNGLLMLALLSLVTSLLVALLIYVE